MTWQETQTRLLMHLFRGVFHARRVEGRLRPRAAAERIERDQDDLRRGRAARASRPGPAPRNILFITTDQQRYDALSRHGGPIARTPHIDSLGVLDYQRAHVENVVCMPARSSMLTGQYPHTHGVLANGIALPDDAPSVARYLRQGAGYRTALIGKAHFDPHLDLALRFYENRCAAAGTAGPWHGFEHLELATHGPVGGHHYADWLWREHPEHVAGFAGVLSAAAGGDTGAPEVKHNPIPRELYHTEWVADRTIEWLKTVPQGEPWLCWMSFPDPHHPFDPPYDEVRRRLDWRDVPLPAGHPGSHDRIEAILSQKPRHWLDWFRGRFRNPEGGPIGFTPCQLSDDSLREINAMIHVENELIDEAVGRVLAWLRAAGIDDDTDVFYTSDHGELQGDFGLVFKGPYHVESLLHIPLLWRPAPRAGISPQVVHAPVGHIDLAPTFCAVAGLPVAEWMQGRPLPTDRDDSRERLLTTFDSQFAAVGMHLRTLYRDGFLCTAYLPRTRDEGGRFPLFWGIWGRGSAIPTYDGSEGELYDLRSDPHQHVNLWNDPARRSLRDDLLDDLRASLPPRREPPLPVAAPT